MKRREFLTLVGGAVAGWPLISRAQQPMPIIGFLNIGSPGPFTHLVAAFHRGLNEAGFFEGRNCLIEYRWAEGRYDRLPSMAAELIDKGVAVIVATGGENVALAAKAASDTIPIVYAGGGDPV